MGQHTPKLYTEAMTKEKAVSSQKHQACAAKAVLQNGVSSVAGQALRPPVRATRTRNALYPSQLRPLVIEVIESY